MIFRKMANTTYYFDRVFAELFDLQVRLMEIEGMQGLDYQDGESVLDGPGYKKENMEEVLYKRDFDPDLFVFWLLTL